MIATAARKAPAWAAPLWRTVSAFGGGYLVCSGWTALSGVLFGLLFADRVEGVVFGAISGFVIYVAIIIWLFGTPQPWRDGALTFLLGCAMVALVIVA